MNILKTSQYRTVGRPLLQVLLTVLKHSIGWYEDHFRANNDGFRNRR